MRDTHRAVLPCRRGLLTRSVLSCAGAVALAAGVPAQTPVPGPVAGNEFRVNALTALDQSTPAVATGANGGFVVAWTDEAADLTDYDVRAGLVDATGSPIGTFLVNTATAGKQYEPAIASDSAGNFVVVWSHRISPGLPDAEIQAQRFDLEGNPLGSEFQVNTFTTGYQILADVARNDSGFVVVWSSIPFMSQPPQDGDQGGVYAQMFDPDGAAVGGEFRVNGSTAADQRLASVGMNAAGQFVVAWTGGGDQDGDNVGIFARRFDAAGSPQGGEFQVNTYTTNAQILPDVAVGPSGEFVVSWQDLAQDLSQQGVFARLFDASGNARGDEFRVNTYTTNSQNRAEVAMDTEGTFVITWQGSGQDGSLTGVFAQRYRADGRPQGPEYLVNQYTTSTQFLPAVVTDARGQTLIAWSSFNQDVPVEGEGEDIYVRRFGFPDARPYTVDTSANGVLESGETVPLVSSWRNRGTSPLPLTSSLTNLTGPPGPTYTIDDGTASCGTIAPGGTNDCATASGDCYSVTISGARPAQHWDATFDEALSSSGPLGGVSPLAKTWALHVGGSFPDMPQNIFYPFVENLFHNGITGGCAGGGYCPGNDVTRAQMAVFLLKSKFGSAYLPPAATGAVFTDVPDSNPFAPWIENLAALGITGGCGGGLYCPNNPVTRQQMAVFLLKTLLGSTYVPQPCAGDFDDVPCPSQFADWIEDLYGRSITGGCQASPPLYCPANPNLRQQMAVFLVKTFGLQLYGPD